MNTFFKSLVTIAILSSSAAFAQKSSMDSPNNYKRPVSQQRAAQSETVGISTQKQVSTYASSAIHNYKRQGMKDVTSEALLVFQMPRMEPAPLNPLLSPNHYKLHFKSISTSESVAVQNSNDTTQIKKSR